MAKERKRIKFKLRIVITALFFVFQVFFIYLTAFVLKQDYFWLYTLLELIGVFTVIYIVNKRGNPSYKIAWIVFILTLPVFGILVYLLWGGQRTFPHLKRKMKKCEANYKKLLKQDQNVKDLINYENNALTRQAFYICNESGYPVYNNTSVEYLSPGEVFFTRFLEELSKAQKYIFLEYFIIAEGKMWNEIFKILTQKASEGVEIKIIFDDFGSANRQFNNFITKLKSKNISVAVFNPVKPPFDIFMNNRNHRKITVIDGNVAFTGGINIGDEYINAYERFGYWLDSAVMLKGKAVDSFTVMFATMWEYITSEPIRLSRYLLSRNEESNGYVIPYCDGPMDYTSTAQGIYMQIINTSHRFVYIATPYLILDNNMINSIVLAAKSGVDIRIVTPSIPDKFYVHPATQFHYSELLEAGVRIYEYTPGFIHSKMFVCDDLIATVGSVNMDFRSFVFHFESGAWFTNENVVGEIKAHFKNIFDKSKEIKLSEWKKRSLFTRIKQWFFHLFSPLM